MDKKDAAHIDDSIFRFYFFYDCKLYIFIKIGREIYFDIHEKRSLHL